MYIYVHAHTTNYLRRAIVRFHATLANPFALQLSARTRYSQARSYTRPRGISERSFQSTPGGSSQRAAPREIPFCRIKRTDRANEYPSARRRSNCKYLSGPILSSGPIVFKELGACAAPSPKRSARGNEHSDQQFRPSFRAVDFLLLLNFHLIPSRALPLSR